MRGGETRRKCGRRGGTKSSGRLFALPRATFTIQTRFPSSTKMSSSLPTISPPATPSPPSDIDSLPSSPTSSSLSDDLGESDAEREWKESLQQLELLLTMVVVPYVGKYFGRKCAYWGEFMSLVNCHCPGGFREGGTGGKEGDRREKRCLTQK